MHPVGKIRASTINKPEEPHAKELHAKGFISDAQLKAVLSKDSQEISKANEEALALYIYTLDDFSEQNPMTSGQTDTVKNAQGLSKEQKKANADLVITLKNKGYEVVSGLPRQQESIVISLLKNLTEGHKPDLRKLYEAHQQCDQKLKTTSASNLDGSDSEDSETDSTEESDTIVDSSDNDADNIPLSNYPKKSKPVSHASNVEDLLAKLSETKTFGSSDMYVMLYKPNLKGEHVACTIGTPRDNKTEVVLIHCGDRFDAALGLPIPTTV